MGEPAEPTEAERKERWQLAAAIVESVRNDEEMPIGIEWPKKVPLDCPDCPVSAIEELIFDLAQEITILLAEREGKGT
jgi:hypothetical protein